MENLFKFLNQFAPYIIIGLAILVLILFIMVLVSFKSIGRIEKRYKKLMRGVSSKNLEELVLGYFDKVDESNAIAQNALDQCGIIEDRLKGCVQKVSMIRFKAFEDIGSDLSFSVALLDENNDGVILTGIYGRQESTTYAKPIDKGISRYDLSDEELTVLNDAISKSI